MPNPSVKYVGPSRLSEIFGYIKAELDKKVNTVSGKGLSSNDYTTSEKNKLEGIASGAQVNVKSDWNETSSSSDAYILNKPTKLSDFTNDAGYITSYTNTWRKVQLNGTDKLGTATNTNPLNFKAGTNVSITESSGTFTFSATDTTYESKAAASGGTAVSLVTTGEKYTWNNKSNLAIGTTATTAAAGNHTHTLSIAADSGTNALTLAASTKYKLTAGGNTFIFTTPPNSTYNFSGTTFYSGKSDTAEHNANNAVKNGNYYYTSNGPATAQGFSTNDGALYVQSYSDSWVGQISQDYRNGKLQVRGKNNGTWYPWIPVMTFEDSYGLYYTATKFLFNGLKREIKANKSTSAWDAQVYSHQGYVSSFTLTFKPSQTNMAIMVGICSSPSGSASYTALEYCWYLQNDGKVNIYESGSAKLTAYAYAVGDDFRITYDGINVKYIHNGASIRTVALAYNSSKKFYFDSSFHGATGGIYDFDFRSDPYSVMSYSGSLTKSQVTTALGYTPPTTNTTYSAGTGLSLSSTTFSLASGVVTAGTKGPTANVTGNEGNTIKVPKVTVDTYGRVTGLAEYTLTCKNTTYSTTTSVTSGSSALITSGGVYDATGATNYADTTNLRVNVARCGSCCILSITCYAYTVSSGGKVGNITMAAKYRPSAARYSGGVFCNSAGTGMIYEAITINTNGTITTGAAWSSLYGQITAIYPI